MTTANNITETVAADSLATHPSDFSRSDLMSLIVTDLSKKTWKDLSDLFTRTIVPGGTYASSLPAGADGDANKATIAMKGDAKTATIKAVREDLASLFEDQKDLSEDFIKKASTLFEAAINARVAIETVRIEDEKKVEADKSVEEIKEQLAGKIDEYLDYAADKWMEENQPVVEASIQVDLVKSFMTKLAALMNESFVKFPEDGVDVLAVLTKKVEDLEAKLAATIDETIALKNQNESLTVQKVFGESAEGLTLADKEKFKTLSESVDFDGDVDGLKEKLKVIKEAHFKTAASKPAANSGIVLEEGSDPNDEASTKAAAANTASQPDPRVARYVQVFDERLPGDVR